VKSAWFGPLNKEHDGVALANVKVSSTIAGVPASWNRPDCEYPTRTMTELSAPSCRPAGTVQAKFVVAAPEPPCQCAVIVPALSVPRMTPVAGTHNPPMSVASKSRVYPVMPEGLLQVFEAVPQVMVMMPGMAVSLGEKLMSPVTLLQFTRSSNCVWWLWGVSATAAVPLIRVRAAAAMTAMDRRSNFTRVPLALRTTRSVASGVMLAGNSRDDKTLSHCCPLTKGESGGAPCAHCVSHRRSKVEAYGCGLQQAPTAGQRSFMTDIRVLSGGSARQCPQVGLDLALDPATVNQPLPKSQSGHRVLTVLKLPADRR